MSYSNYMDEARLDKLKKLTEMGIRPYPYRFERTHMAHEVADRLEELAAAKTEVKVAGRLIARREHGKTIFGSVEDGSGRIQIYLRQDFLGDQFALLDLFDIGDFIGITGEPFRTRTGEPTVLVKSFELLSKSLRPLPEKFHGLKDTELRFRQRSLDLIANPEVRRIFVLRTKIVQLIRRFLAERNYLEFETPILQPIYGGAASRPFETHYHALDQQVFLRIADELYLKRLVIGGFERVYEIGKDFRNEGLDRFHNPEFTQVEMYQAYADYHDLMVLVEDLFRFIAQSVAGSDQIDYQGTVIDFSRPWLRLSFIDELEAKTGVPNILGLSDPDLVRLCDRSGVEVAPDTPRAKRLDKLFSQLIQNHIVQPTFVVDHPLILSPLAKTHRNHPDRVERFEPVIAGIELGNAFSELNDPVEQRARFRDQIAARDEYTVLDDDFLTALEHGMPPCAGLGIGVDRLVMLFANVDSIREVILFPQLKPEKSDV